MTANNIDPVILFKAAMVLLGGIVVLVVIFKSHLAENKGDWNKALNSFYGTMIFGGIIGLSLFFVAGLAFKFATS